MINEVWLQTEEPTSRDDNVTTEEKETKEEVWLLLLVLHSLRFSHLL